ncbi:MAG: hypothetical protein HPY61_10320 [Methanotrichaceae archaeon]|nr:hypothetical protein [Methanotrichaceae archaeon]
MKFRRIMLFIAVFLLLAASGFSQGTSHHVATDPAIREMIVSMDIPRASDPSKFSYGSSSVAPSANLAGKWHLELDEGTIMDLTLRQSGNVLFGSGSIKPVRGMMDATAAGSISDGILHLDVVPTDGSEMFAVSLNVGLLPLLGTYTRFASGIDPESGSLKASWLAG